jgi:hypothetical protein
MKTKPSYLGLLNAISAHVDRTQLMGRDIAEERDTIRRLYALAETLKTKARKKKAA